MNSLLLSLYKMFSFLSINSFPKPFSRSGWIPGPNTKDDLASGMTLVLWQNNKYRFPIVQDRDLSIGEKNSDSNTSMLPWKAESSSMEGKGNFYSGYPARLGPRAGHSSAWSRSIFSSFLGTQLCIPSWYTAPCPRGTEKIFQSKKLW